MTLASAHAKRLTGLTGRTPAKECAGSSQAEHNTRKPPIHTAVLDRYAPPKKGYSPPFKRRCCESSYHLQAHALAECRTSSA